ncbi:hypothetical protein BDQ12DRAFT_743774 [Crucibulum laeve]|uniref:Uncharacterized protein n=1 Tax=Crucibulum laeve TaxID=68775 RepID=A0A5C3M6L7_9AGAR|nr:hypothetical protein BDQ12DRAFT_743774 [Crucibulum laeve]
MRKRVHSIEHGASSSLKNIDTVKKKVESDYVKMIRALEMGSGPSRRISCSIKIPDPHMLNRSAYITMKEDMRYKETSDKFLASIKSELRRFQSKVQGEVDNKLAVALENMRRSCQTPENNPCSISPVSTEASHTIDELNEQVFESHKWRPSTDDALARTFQDFEVNRARQVALDNEPNIWSESILSAANNNPWGSPKLYISPLSGSGTSSKPASSKGKGHTILKENSSISDEAPSTSHVATIRGVRSSSAGRSAPSTGDRTVKQRGAESNSCVSSADTEDVWAIPKQCISPSPSSIPLTQVVADTQSSVPNHLPSSTHISISSSEIMRQDEWYIENDESLSTTPCDAMLSNEDPAVFTAELSASKTMAHPTNFINLKVELDEMRTNPWYDMTILNCDYKEDTRDNGSSSSSSEDDEVPTDVECEPIVSGSGQVAECMTVEDNSLASVLVSTYSILVLFYIQLWSPLLALGRRKGGVYSEIILVGGTRHVV